MARERLTYHQLFELLSLFGFRAAPTQEKWNAFDHPDADWYFLFVALDPTSQVREIDLAPSAFISTLGDFSIGPNSIDL